MPAEREPLVRRRLVHRSSGLPVGAALLPRTVQSFQGLLLLPTTSTGARLPGRDRKCSASQAAAASLAASMIAELRARLPESAVASKVEDQGSIVKVEKVAIDTDTGMILGGSMGRVGAGQVARGSASLASQGKDRVRENCPGVATEGNGLKGSKEDLGRPGEFGWQREVVRHPQGGHVTGVHYLTPPHPATGERRRFKRMKEIAAYLATAGTPQLSLNNFVLSSRALGLAFEVERQPIHPGSTTSPFAQWIRRIGDGKIEDGRTVVGCTLCSDTVPIGSFSRHMRKHLPEEECGVCGREFPPGSRQFSRHRRTCRPQAASPSAASLPLSSTMVGKGTALAPPLAGTAGEATGELVTLNFQFKTITYRVKVSVGKKMNKALRVVARKVGQEVGELRFVARSTGAEVCAGEQVDRFVEEVIVIRESD